MEENGEKIIIDANILVGAYYFHDALHEKVAKALKSLHSFQPRYYTNNYIIAETITVLLVRSRNIKISKLFGETIYSEIGTWFKVLQFDKDHQKSAFEIFRKQDMKCGLLSFQDCTLIAQARKQKIKTILTFDKTFKQFEEEGIRILP